MNRKFGVDELLAPGPQRVFEDERLNQVVFPIGGIGAGFVGLTGHGGLKDVSIFNRPNFGGVFPFTFPLIYAKAQGKDPVCRVLRGPVPPPHVMTGSFPPHTCGEGFPHMDSCSFRGEYPFAWIDFRSKKLPVKVSLEAYNPFIPSDPDNSGFPAAILRYTVKNKTRTTVRATVAWSILNAVGSIGEAEREPRSRAEFGFGQNVNAFREDAGLRGLYLHSTKWAKDHPRFGSMALLTPDKPVTFMKYWLRDRWFAEPQHELWDKFSATGLLPDHDYGPSTEGVTTPGALGIRVTLKPGEAKTVTFYLTWYFPNFEKYWASASEIQACCTTANGAARAPQWKNYYASQFRDAFDVAVKLHRKEQSLHAETKKFHDALFSSTLPPYVIDAVSSQMAILKTATCLRLTDGTFYAFEGSTATSGCCEGSCTHVWNYQQTLPFLFPSLERSMRTADYTYNMREKGSMGFRINLPIGSKPNDFLPCADGQLGGIIKTYRDWKISGDDAWLEAIWPQVKQALEFAWVEWDANKDGVIDGVQHNTYDIEFLGPNPLTACFYLGALEAGARMAEHLGQAAKAADYRQVAEQGRKWVEKHLFNGEFYIQRYDRKKAPVHQFGKGCISDALLGQWMAQVAGLGYVIDPKRVKKTLESIFKYNWRASLREHACGQTLVCALNDDAGLLACSWPNGGKPKVPFAYYNEVWAGIEYHVASHCIMEGLIKEGLTIAKAVRDRHDGFLRNPWDQFECCGGHHYARVMSSYGLLTALSGFTYDVGRGAIGFAPRIHADDFQTFWALDGAWGTYSQKGKVAKLTVLWGKLRLNRLDLPAFANREKVRVTLGNRAVNAKADNSGAIRLPKTLTLNAGAAMKLNA
ncbi:MAG TPA: hypothetical protein HPP83_01555 [Candidatus Hydrogenedentes bacterium]|nr:hypothetical protein [Candidatus Hydrogenedentota bacterium]